MRSLHPAHLNFSFGVWFRSQHPFHAVRFRPLRPPSLCWIGQRTSQAFLVAYTVVSCGVTSKSSPLFLPMQCYAKIFVPSQCYTASAQPQLSRRPSTVPLSTRLDLDPGFTLTPGANLGYGAMCTCMSTCVWLVQVFNIRSLHPPPLSPPPSLSPPPFSLWNGPCPQVCTS